jgi:hypothetical protein
VFPIEIKAGDALEGDIQIRYKGQAIENLFLVRVKLKNTGSVAIRKADIVEPVTFTFGPSAQFLRKPRVLYKNPDNLKVAWDFSESFPAFTPRGMSLNFDLLNSGEELTAEFMCTGESTLPKVTARIEGISEIKLLDPEEMYLRRKVTENILSFGSLFMVIVVGGLTSIAADRLITLIPLSEPTARSVLPVMILLVFSGLLWFLVGRPVFKLVQYRRYGGKS